jgi:hypothetical protein
MKHSDEASFELNGKFINGRLYGYGQIDYANGD